MPARLEKTFGLDINSNALTAVEFSNTKDGLKVLNYSRVPLEPGIIEDDVIVIQVDAFKEALARLLAEARLGPIRTRNVIISIPESKTFTHHFSVPFDRLKDHAFVMEAAKDFVPIDLDEAVVDYKPVQASAKTDAMVSIDFVAIQKTIVASFLELLGEAGLNVVAVDIDRDSILRAAHQTLAALAGHPVNDCLILHVGESLTNISISLAPGEAQTLSCQTAGADFCKTVAQALNLPTVAVAKEILQRLSLDPSRGATDPQFALIRDALAESIRGILEKVDKLIRMHLVETGREVGSLCLSGDHSRAPGLIETLGTTYPKITLLTELSPVRFTEHELFYYTVAIGLALRGAVPEGSRNAVNLLPYEQKEQLDLSRLLPFISRTVVVVFFSLLLMTAGAGYFSTHAYVDLNASNSELKISSDKVSNPYLNEIAKTTEQRSQLEGQLSKILANDLPASIVISKIDDFDHGAITLISLDYTIGDKDEVLLRVRAHSRSRKDAEEFIAELDKDDAFKEVISPISNLSEKGESTISIELKLNKDVFIKTEEDKRNALSAEPAPEKTPSLPEAPKPQGGTPPDAGGGGGGTPTTATPAAPAILPETPPVPAPTPATPPVPAVTETPPSPNTPQ